MHLSKQIDPEQLGELLEKLDHQSQGDNKNSLLKNGKRN
jgi:hypothetical protein